jgi:predicted metalloprotease with PDZ domain
MFGDFPSSEFHFIVQMLPYKFYHGVEHLKSTVLALGPGSDLMNDEMYINFVGVASHELFHVWNVKTIRPSDMLPYNYTKENYSRLGFVYEGVTTYYGDMFLMRSGVFTSEQFFSEINQRIQKHMDNFGRYNMPVVDASFDTWLDGYIPGIPHRKTSIYDEGCLIALMTDLLIRSKTTGRTSLNQVMQLMYTDFGKQKIGYSEHDYMTVVENVAGESLSDFFMDYVYGTEPFLPMIQSLLSNAGCELEVKPSKNYFEEHFGFKINVINGITKVALVAPGSSAEHAGMGKDDEIIAVNEIKVDGDLDSLCRNYAGEKIVVTLLTSMKKLKDIALVPSQNPYFNRYKIRKLVNANSDQKEFFRSWLNAEF